MMPCVLLEIVGYLVSSVVPTASDVVGGFPVALPGWFAVPYLLFVVVQKIALNTFNLYSSGLTLQAIGVKTEALEVHPDRLEHLHDSAIRDHLLPGLQHVPIGVPADHHHLGRALGSGVRGRLGDAARQLRPAVAVRPGRGDLLENPGGSSCQESPP